MKIQTLLLSLAILGSCMQDTSTNEKETSVLVNDSSNVVDSMSYYYLKDTTLKLLSSTHPDNSSEITTVIDEEYWKTMPDPVKAALGYTTYCAQNGGNTPSRLNSKHKLLLTLARNQYKDTFLRQWFRNDTQCLNKLAQGPDCSYNKESIDEIGLTIKGDTIKIHFKIEPGLESWGRMQEDIFKLEQNNLVLIKENKRKIFYPQ